MTDQSQRVTNGSSFRPAMRVLLFVAALFARVQAGDTQSMPEDSFESLKSLAGTWEANLTGYGKLTNSIRLVSNGTAIEETIGTAADNELSIYTRDGGRILLTHFCALTPGGHAASVHLDDGPRSPLRKVDQNGKRQGHGI